MNSDGRKTSCVQIVTSASLFKAALKRERDVLALT